VLDHPGLLRVFVVMGVLAATALSFNLVETAPSSGLLGGPPVGSLSSVSSPQVLTPHIADNPCGNQQSLVVGPGDGDGSSTCPSTTTTNPVPPSDPATVSGSADAPTGTVTTVSPAYPGFWTQQSTSASGTGSISAGQSIADTATVAGNSIGGPPTGSVTFYVCGPQQAVSTCAQGIQVGEEPVPLSTLEENESTATSVSFYPDETGTYCFGAVYTPANGANYKEATENLSGDVDANECFVVGTASFRVLKTDQPGDGKPVTPGSTVPYTVEIQNVGAGPGSATVTDTLPSNLSLKDGDPPVCAVTAPDTCQVANPTGSTWTFTVSLAAGDQATVTFGATVSTSDTTDVVNTATITQGACDNGTVPVEDLKAHAAVDNCTSTVTNPVPDFTVAKTDTPGNGTAVPVGGTISYTIVVKNVGDGAGSTTVTDTVPSALTVSGTPGCAVTAPDVCTMESTTAGPWPFTVSLASGDSATVTFSAAVAASAAGTTVVNTATIGDPCNTASGCSSSVSNPVTPVTLATTSAGTTPPSTTPSNSPSTSPSTTGPVTSASTLAFTGAYLALLALLALTLLASGASLVLLSHWRRVVPKHAARK
jgi:fimbrial isopeptide formation D2 family protein